MPLIMSDRFACAHASGGDWREISRKVLADLEKAKKGHSNYKLGFLFISDALGEDVETILTLFKSVTGIEQWVGAVGAGICATNKAYAEEPAIVAMMGRFNPQDMCVFPSPTQDPASISTVLNPWLAKKDPMLVLVHGSERNELKTMQQLPELERIIGGFISGGLTSMRRPPVHITNKVCKGGLSGVIFSENVQVATCLSQGSLPFGPNHAVTACDENMVLEIDGRKASEVLSEDLKLISNDPVKSPKDMKKEKKKQEEQVEAPAEGQETQKKAPKAQIHMAFMVPDTDQRGKDYMVRNIVDIDHEEGSVSVGHHPDPGDRVTFVFNNPKTMQAELSRNLLALRSRVEKDHGAFKPKGALYYSCVSRAINGFELDPEPAIEMRVLKEILGDIPLAGIFGNAQIANRRLYKFASQLILFL